MKLLRNHCANGPWGRALLTALLSLGALPGFLKAPCQTRSRTEAVLRLVADRILKSSELRFVDEKGRSYADLANVPLNLQMRVESPYEDWHYTNGVLNIALLELSGVLQDPRYQAHVDSSMRWTFRPSNLGYFRAVYDSLRKGPVGADAVTRHSWYMLFRMIRLDDYGTMAASLVDLSGFDAEASFRRYIEAAAAELRYAEPRLADGTIARYVPRRMTVWADDLYMSVSFLARLGRKTGQHRYFDDALRQVEAFHRYLWDPREQLYFHCYYTASAHHGVAHWGRCNGWVLMAEADLLAALPQSYAGRQQLIRLFREQVRGLARYQSASGLWRQLLDKTDSYEETSCSAMFVYAIARGVRQGWLDPSYTEVALAGWKGLLRRVDARGHVSGICPGTGISQTLSAYYQRPMQQDLAMGVGPLLRAGVQILQLKPYGQEPASLSYPMIRARRLRIPCGFPEP